MMDIYIMQYNYRSRYLVLINENASVSVHKHEKYKFDQPFLSSQAKNKFICKSKTCSMTEFSGALKNPNFDGKTFSLECEKSKYVFISGLEIFEFITSNKIIDYISLMGNNMTPYVFALGSKYTYLISTRYKFIENDKIQEGTLLNLSNDSLDSYDYHLRKNGKDCLEKMLDCNRMQSSRPGKECGFMEEIVEDEDEEDAEEDGEEDVDIHELEYTDGNIDAVKTFSQKCVICLERDSDYIFKRDTDYIF